MLQTTLGSFVLLSTMIYNMIYKKITEMLYPCAVQGLRTYLLAYGAFYHSLSQEQLSEMFDMTDKEVRHLTLSAPLSIQDMRLFGCQSLLTYAAYIRKWLSCVYMLHALLLLSFPVPA